MHRPLHDLARKKGFRVLLTGVGGDHWFSGSLDHYTDYLRKLQLWRFARQVYYDQYDTYLAGVNSLYCSARRALRIGVVPLMPTAIRRVLKLFLQQRHNNEVKILGIPRNFSHRVGLYNRTLTTNGDLQFTTFAQRHIYGSLAGGLMPYGLEVMSRLSESSEVELRHPFLDQKVIELALALPEEQRWRRNEVKYIIRQAMKGYLPEVIRNRLTKAEFSHVFAGVFQSLGGFRLFDSLSIGLIGWVDQDEVLEMYREFEELYSQNDPNYGSHLRQLWSIVGINIWFNVVFLNNRGDWRD